MARDAHSGVSPFCIWDMIQQNHSVDLTKHSYNSLAFSGKQFVLLRTSTHPTHPCCIFTPPTSLIVPLCCHSSSQPRKICACLPFGESDQFVSS